MKPESVIEKTTEIVKKDTIVEWKYSTDTVYFSKIKYKDKIVYDTIHKNNVVYIRDTAVVHRDSTSDYTIDISAVRLDWYKLDINHRDTITYTQTIYETVYKKRNNKPQIGVYGGLGYDINGKTFGTEVGVGIVIPLTKW